MNGTTGEPTSTETNKKQPTGEPTSTETNKKQPAGEPTSTETNKKQPAGEPTKLRPGGVSSAPPYESMLRSTMYERLRAQHPAEFEPASVFFTHDERSFIDRRKSLRVKAALVYEAVTGRHEDDDQMQSAKILLLALAKKCHSKMHPETAVVHGGGRGTGTGIRSCVSLHLYSALHAAGETGGDAADETGWDDKMMRVLDGIFLVVGFLPKLNEAISSSNADRDSVDQSFRSRHMLEMVADVVKLENQLLWLQDLLDVAGHIEAVIKETVEQHDFRDVKKAMGREYKQEVTAQNLADVIHRFCWYYSPFATKKPAPDSPFKDVVANKEMAAKRTLLDCLHMSVVKPSSHGKGGSGGIGRPSRMPTARDLWRSGVRLQASENGRAEIEFAQPTLWLPALVYDFKLATVARNLLVLEYDEEQSKPITRYFQMMNEIVEDAADVRILRRAGVVRGGQEVHELIKNIDSRAMYPSVYMAMDREIDKVREYHDKRMASFFVRNRPGVIWASSVAAISMAAVVASMRKRG
ncbi:hypothetical protein ZEAMMB73_Zm00001d036255 [Zea mays]|uniref:Uncharacterized protein n=1 Tax=Zea mays TaxID=4577 RepID=A0A1D6LLE3_MAIZE|nr:hypothetical protein ZEAMMB73_Zm00001d036255 [Zea mays]